MAYSESHGGIVLGTVDLWEIALESEWWVETRLDGDRIQALGFLPNQQMMEFGGIVRSAGY